MKLVFQILIYENTPVKDQLATVTAVLGPVQRWPEPAQGSPHLFSQRPPPAAPAAQNPSTYMQSL